MVLTMFSTHVISTRHQLKSTFLSLKRLIVIKDVNIGKQETKFITSTEELHIQIFLIKLKSSIRLDLPHYILSSHIICGYAPKHFSHNIYNLQQL
jgi:hypothetical protein